MAACVEIQNFSSSVEKIIFYKRIYEKFLISKHPFYVPFII